MENIDPIGIHTGDSFVVAPTQTLTAKECNMLKASAIKIIKALKIEGGCNVQFALDTVSNQYYVIEVNPRVSRSSALASKASGYPIAKITTKIAIGYNLHEIKISITQTTLASFEPTLDYVVVKIPKWPFDKFSTGDRMLGTKMKATGEIMAIGRTFISSFKKAVTSLEERYTGLSHRGFETLEKADLLKELALQDDRRIFRLAQALYNGIEIARALHRNALIHMQGDRTIAVQCTHGKGGTWAGCLDNLRHGWSPLFVFQDSSPAMAALMEQGATGIKQLTTISGLTPTQISLF